MNVIEKIVALALTEDLGKGDVSGALIPKQQEMVGIIYCREQALLAGAAYVDEVFRQVDHKIKVEWFCKEGDSLHANQKVCRISGSARSILAAERCALNFLQTLSATASVTREYVACLQGTKTKLLDTRKTIPGLRYGQKQAVLSGGGVNHRQGLFDAILLKENHIAASGSITNAVEQAKQNYPDVFVEVEVETLSELKEALTTPVDRIMLDNFDLDELKKAVALTKGQVKLEASGNISKENLRAVAETGVDYISLGALTKNIRAIDFSLRFET